MSFALCFQHQRAGLGNRRLYRRDTGVVAEQLGGARRVRYFVNINFYLLYQTPDNRRIGQGM